MFHYYAYILKSLKDGRYYYGSTQDLQQRLKNHNLGKVKATKPRHQLVLHYCEEFVSRKEAVKRELYFKSIDGYLWLKAKKII